MSPSSSGSDFRTNCVLSISDSSMVGEARRTAQSMARAVALDETAEGRVGIIVTELASNLCRHAKTGRIFLRSLGPAVGIEILSVDSGQGMDVQKCLVDGYSSASTMGGGLGAVQRQSDRFDAYSKIGKGTVVLSQVLSKSSENRPDDIGIVRTPFPGETVCGDSWVIRQFQNQTQTLAAVIDGLGHGIRASEAADAAVDLLERVESRDPEQILKLLHGQLRSTRGAAASIVFIDKASAKLTFSGIGNVRGCTARGENIKGLVSFNGTLGLQIRSVRNFTQDFGEDELVILHSDGISAKWELSEYPGLAQRSAGVVAGTIHRDWGRANDDATILVYRSKPRWLKGK